MSTDELPQSAMVHAMRITVRIENGIRLEWREGVRVADVDVQALGGGVPRIDDLQTVLAGNLAQAEQRGAKAGAQHGIADERARVLRVLGRWNGDSMVDLREAIACGEDAAPTFSIAPGMAWRGSQHDGPYVVVVDDVTAEHVSFRIDGAHDKASGKLTRAGFESLAAFFAWERFFGGP